MWLVRTIFAHASVVYVYSYFILRGYSLTLCTFARFACLPAYLPWVVAAVPGMAAKLVVRVHFFSCTLVLYVELMLSRYVCLFYVLAAVVGMASKSCRSAVFLFLSMQTLTYICMFPRFARSLFSPRRRRCGYLSVVVCPSTFLF